MSQLLSARWTPPPTRPLVLGHRGARHAAPENTFAAFDLALREGAEGVELDVRMNAGGDVIVCHDVTLERVTKGRDLRAIDDLGTAECRAVRLEGGERLPFLREVLDWADERGACLNVELKTDGRRRRALVRAVAELTRPRAKAGNVLISSFNPLAVLAHRALAPAIASAWLVESAASSELPLVPRAGSVALHPKHTLITPARLALWRARVGRVHAWTVNDPVRARELAALGVECLISDNPGRLIAALGATARAPEVHAGGGRLHE
ncbi:MAG TPA: glycerophosphodiester phosphodiesterase family protein [Polyangiaceae bacterium]|nr:glycerophosphodiester phosphodiesterase family protein [Polyangiaceae bacterium]